MKKIITLLFCIILTLRFSVQASAASYPKTVNLEAETLVFLQLQKDEEILLIYLEKGGYYCHLDSSRIIKTTTADSQDLPEYHKFLKRDKKTDLDSLVEKIDLGSQTLSTAELGTKFLVEKSRELFELADEAGSKMRQFWEESGVAPKIRDWLNCKK